MKHLASLALCTALLTLTAWPDTSLTDLGKDLITSTGVVSNSELDALITAGGKFKEAASPLTGEQEYYLGRGVSALILRKYPLYTAEPKLTHYVNLVGNALAGRSDRPEIFGGYHFAILDTEDVNALSAPGGFIFISRGFLKLIPFEDSLAGVLAHEIAHVAKKHGVNAISQAHLTEAVMVLGKEAASSYGPSELNLLTDAFGASADQIFDTLIKSGYSRTQEYEADAYAAALLVKTGYSPKGLTSMLKELAKINAQSRGGWFDTHPAPQDRIASLKIGKAKPDISGLEARASRYDQMTLK